MTDHSNYLIINIFTNLKTSLSNKIYASEKEDINTKTEDVTIPENVHNITDEDINAFINQQTGFSRIKAMFFPENYLNLSPQMELVASTVIQTGFTFAVVSSIFGSLAAREKFLLKSQHKSYRTNFIANRGFQDASIIGGLRYGLRFGFKAALFSGIFMITSQTVSAYRNKTGILEHVIAGGVTCGTLRINGGPKAFIGAGTIGLFLGLVGGIFMNVILKEFGYSQEKLNFDAVKENFAFARPQLD